MWLRNVLLLSCPYGKRAKHREFFIHLFYIFWGGQELAQSRTYLATLKLNLPSYLKIKENRVLNFWYLEIWRGETRERSGEGERGHSPLLAPSFWKQKCWSSGNKSFHFSFEAERTFLLPFKRWIQAVASLAWSKCHQQHGMQSRPQNKASTLHCRQLSYNVIIFHYIVCLPQYQYSHVWLTCMLARGASCCPKCTMLLPKMHSVVHNSSLCRTDTWQTFVAEGSHVVMKPGERKNIKMSFRFLPARLVLLAS